MLTKGHSFRKIIHIGFPYLGRKGKSMHPGQPGPGASGLGMISRKTIVVAERDPGSRELICEILSAEGYSVIAVADRQAALEKALAAPPDLLILGVHLPMIGSEPADTFRNAPCLTGLRVLAVTAHAMVGDKERVLAGGFDECITKPIDALLFKQRVRELLQTKPEPRD